MLESLRQRPQGWKHFPDRTSKGNCCSSTEALAIITSFIDKMFSVTTASELSYKHAVSCALAQLVEVVSL